MVMSSSLQCFWQVWLSSLPELNSLHSMQSLQKDTERKNEYRKRSFRVNHFYYKDGFVSEVDSVKKQIAVGLETVCPLDVGSCISVTAKSLLSKIKAEAWPGHLHLCNHTSHSYLSPEMFSSANLGCQPTEQSSTKMKGATRTRTATLVALCIYSVPATLSEER